MSPSGKNLLVSKSKMFLASNQKHPAKRQTKPQKIIIKDLISWKTVKMRSISGDIESIRIKTFADLKIRQMRFKLRVILRYWSHIFLSWQVSTPISSESKRALITGKVKKMTSVVVL